MEKYNSPRIDNNKIEKRDGHRGSEINFFWSKNFLKQIEQRGYFND